MEPENSRPATPLMPVTLAESTSTKSSGWFSTSSHSTPIASMRTGRNAGHLKLSPVAEPIGEEDPEAGLGVERAVAEEAEVPRLAGQLQGADLDRGADGEERDEVLGGGRAGVEHEVPRA